MKPIIPAIIIVLAAVALLAWNLTASAVSTQEVLVTKVIDGDTLIIEGGQSVRLLGIDADERGYPCYDEARIALEKMTLSKRVILEMDREDKDMYDRLLRWIWVNDTLVNFELVKSGMAVARFGSDTNNYEGDIKFAERDAIKDGVGCKWSSLK